MDRAGILIRLVLVALTAAWSPAICYCAVVPEPDGQREPSDPVALAASRPWSGIACCGVGDCGCCRLSGQEESAARHGPDSAGERGCGAQGKDAAAFHAESRAASTAGLSLIAGALGHAAAGDSASAQIDLDSVNGPWFSRPVDKPPDCSLLGQSCLLTI
jgi:hypothetical protein